MVKKGANVSGWSFGEFRKNLAEKFNKKGEIFNSFFDPNIKFVEVPKRHKPGVVNYIPKPGGVDETHATGFTKFFTDKTKSQFVGISEDKLSYKYPVVVGHHQGTFRLGIEGGRTVTGLGNADSSLKEGVDYFSGNQRVGADGIHTLPLGFWKNIGKEESDLPHNSRSQLSYMVTAGDLAGKYVFGFGPPTSGMAPDSPHMWQLSSKSIIPDVPNTWDVRGQTMWDQMGEYPWAAYNQPSLQSKGVNFMAGTKKGKDFNPEDDLHPAGFTTNMGKLNWKTGDPHTGIASKLAIPIDENGDRSKIKISANLDGMDGYDFPFPGQGSWHIRKHWNRRHFPPKDKLGHGTAGFYDLNVPGPGEDYPIWSNMNIDASKASAKKASDSLNINEDSENITKLNTMIGASTYKVPKIGSELARKFLHPTAVENSENKFSYIDHYWRWKTPEQIREEAAPGKMQKDQIHPIIYKSLIDMEGENKETFRYSEDTDRTQGSRPTIEFIRGGVRTSINRIKADQERLKTILFKSGNSWQILGKQFLLQALNAREETRVWNPLSILAGAARVVKLERHISAEGVLNTITTSIMNPLNNFLSPGSVSPVIPGLYERYEGYDKWGGDGTRNKKNKLANWAETNFKSEEKDKVKLSWNSLSSALKRNANKALTSAISSVTGYNAGDPDPPSRYVDSQKTLDKKAIHKGTQQKGKQSWKVKEYSKLKNTLGGMSYGYGNSLERKTGQKVVDDVGQQGKPGGNIEYHKKLGWIHPKDSDQIDKINAHRYGDPAPEETKNEFNDERDFVKFRFKDMVRGSNIIFRAILSGINDNITPEWASERYIGRADQVHVYKGADRNISFNFSIAPKSITEFPFLMEKLNYLIGLCYPEYDSSNSNRMVPPMTQLTIGSILDEAPGFLNSLSYTVEESSPWEIKRGMQLPKFINVSCDFRYIGNQLPSKYGQHLGYDQGWFRRVDNAPTPEEKADILSRTTDLYNPDALFDNNIRNMSLGVDPLRQNPAFGTTPRPFGSDPASRLSGDGASAGMAVGGLSLNNGGTPMKLSMDGALPTPAAAKISMDLQAQTAIGNAAWNNKSPEQLSKEAKEAELYKFGGAKQKETLTALNPFGNLGG